MFAVRRKLFAFALALVAACAFAGPADAGWVTFKNDTQKPVTVQEVAFVNGKKVTGKPTKLLAGESFREFQNTPGDKLYEVLDTNNPPQSLWNGKLDCKADMQSFSIVVVNGQVRVFQLPNPKKP